MNVTELKQVRDALERVYALMPLPLCGTDPEIHGLRRDVVRCLVTAEKLFDKRNKQSKP